MNTKRLSILWMLTVAAVIGLTGTMAAHQSENKKSEPRAPAKPLKEWPGDRIGGLIAEWTRAKTHTMRYIELMPEESINFKLRPDVRSFADDMLHIAVTNFGFGSYAVARTDPYKSTGRQIDKMDEFRKSKAALAQIVEDSYDFLIDGLKNLTEAKLDERIPMVSMNRPRLALLNLTFEHQAVHRGHSLMAFLLKGIKPPGDFWFELAASQPAAK